RPVGYKLTARLSVLLPLQGLILLGLSPLKNKTQRPLSLVTLPFHICPGWIGDVSYAQYVFQMAAYAVWPMTDVNLLFFIFLFVVSLFFARVVAPPLVEKWKEAGRAVILVPVAMATILTITHFVYTAARDEVTEIGYFLVEDGVHDLRLNWTTTMSSRVLTNPTFHITPEGEYVRAARAHALATSTFEPGTWTVTNSGGDDTEIDVKVKYNIYAESIVIHSGGTLSLKGDDPSSWSLDGEGELESMDEKILATRGCTIGMDCVWEKAYWDDLCRPLPEYIPQNKTVIRKVVVGPEDPKIIEASGGGDWGLLWSSYPPRVLRETWNTTADRYISTSSCNDEGFRKDGIFQMGMLHNARSVFDGSSEDGVGRVIEGCSFTDNLNEKNWISFRYGGQLMLIYSIFPHRIVGVREGDGACELRYSSSYPQLGLLAQNTELHGSASAIHLQDGNLMALFHTLKGGAYTTYAYTLRGQPPFAVMSVSKNLGLPSDAFASGLAMKDGKVAVAYGRDDAWARVRVWEMDEFMKLFEWC
ncbi:hypothetical protein TrLO_g1026, partial [Triparma laevis f. longispina]